ncbi:MAG: hypothetical protein WCO71_13285, partial [Pseudomonadota bacterium]
VKDIVNSCKNYVNEYGKPPPISTATGGTPNGTPPNGYMSFGDKTDGKCAVDNGQLFDVLRAISRAGGSNAGHILNPRQQKYFEQPKATDKNLPRDGFLDGADFAATPGQLMDPWGKQYCIVLDTDSDDTIDMKDFYTDLTGTDSIRVTAAAFSMARDGVRGTKANLGIFRKTSSNLPPDDVVSWQ